MRLLLWNKRNVGKKSEKKVGEILQEIKETKRKQKV